MANHYCQFSEILANVTPEELAWLVEEIETLIAVDENGVVLEVSSRQDLNLDTDEDLEKLDYFGPRILRDCDEYEWQCADGRLDFEYEVCGDNDRVWFHADESGNPEEVAWVVHKFLQKWRPDDDWSITYACTCSKLRCGEFDGGGIHVTAKHVQFENGGSFCGRCHDDFIRNGGDN